jgi:hypothetical protein
MADSQRLHQQHVQRFEQQAELHRQAGFPRAVGMVEKQKLRLGDITFTEE